MDLKTLEAIPPWEWPQDAGRVILDVLQDDQAEPSDRLLAAELAGDSGDVTDELAGALLAILKNSHEPETLRGLAVISLGPALEYAYMDGFDDPDEVSITEPMFHTIQETLHRLYRDARVPREVMEKISLREKARAEKNFELSDQIRDELLKKGIVLEDTKDGVRWKVVKN